MMSRWKKIVGGAAVVSLLGYVLQHFAVGALDKMLSPLIDGVPKVVSATWDNWVCGGAKAMEQADKLSLEAESVVSQDVRRAGELLIQSNALYNTAYKCGFEDAGLTLAVRYCKGLGAAKDPQHAKRIVFEVEEMNTPGKAGRIRDVRQTCGF